MDRRREDELLCLAIAHYLKLMPHARRDTTLTECTLQRCLRREPAAVHRQHVRRCGAQPAGEEVDCGLDAWDEVCACEV